ncbi:MAG: hypothetical protein Q4B67_01205 [Eubacteriales bacterium]|nr:hypothetical protein [Eubacteriales bacterium]
MSAVTQYKCPSCGAPVEFDSGTQNLKCPYCQSEISIEALEDAAALEEKINSTDKMDAWDTNGGTEWNPEEDGVCTYSCHSCGGQVMGDKNMGASMCPYCGNNIVVSEKFASTLRPDFVIPFKLDKKAAKEALTNHFKGKRLLPRLFKDQNRIDEIKGIYVPFWIYDADVEGSARFNGTTIHSWTSGNYRYTETKHYDILREGSVSFENIPVDASEKMADDLMDSLEPFDMSEAVDFKTAYLAGYFADKYDVSKEATLPRINQRVKTSTETAFKGTVTFPYATLTNAGSYIELTKGSARYALLPVWLLNTTWNGQKFTFAMNGQTGKFVGNLPADKGLCVTFWLTRFLICVPAAALIAYFIWHVIF